MKAILTLVTSLIYLTANAHGLNPQNIKEDTHYHWVKFKAKDKFERSAIADMGLSIEGIVEDSVIAVVDDETFQKVKTSPYFEMSFKLQPRMLDFPAKDEKFHNYAELKAALDTLVAQNPELVKLSTIGRSVQGRDLYMLTFSTVADDKSQPAVFFMGGHHAREHLSVEMALGLAKFFAREYKAGNPRVVDLLKTRTVYIAPLVNPDGAEHDVENGRYKLWRKNRKNNGSTFGVDLNRNYGFGWGGGGASPNPGNDTYRGPSAFSEPETQSIKAFFETHENINICLTYHTFSKLILYPWGHKYNDIENQQDFLVHKTMAETMAAWNGYSPMQSSELYIASGDTTDWTYGQLKVISFTFELDPEMSPDINFNPEKGFYPGQAFIDPVINKNIEPALYLLQYANNPYRVLENKWTSYGFQSPVIK